MKQVMKIGMLREKVSMDDRSYKHDSVVASKAANRCKQNFERIILP